MKWSIIQLQKLQKSGILLDEMIQLDEVKERNSDIRSISPVHVTGHCTIGSQQITCQLRLEGMMILPCARTWEDVEFPFDIRSDEIFTWSEHAGETEDDNVHIVEGDTVDLRPVLEELIILEVPLQVFKEDADETVLKGGQNWSYQTDEQLQAEAEKAQPKTDPRLADLAKFFDQSSDE